MTESDMKLAQQGYDAWNRGDLEWLLEHVTEDVKIQPFREFNGFDDVYRGHQGWVQFWETWHQVWQGAKVKVHRFEDMGDHGVLALLSIDRSSENGDDSTPVSHWLTFRDGKFSSFTAMAPETAERRREERP